MEEAQSKQNENGSQFDDLPDVIMGNIFSVQRESKTRNRMALVCRKWREMERCTRSHLCVRGNMSNLYLIPMCFQAVTHLDLSLSSPWGYPPLDPSPHGQLIAHLLNQAFPRVTSITIYVRHAGNIDMLARTWPALEEVKLVRWHGRASDDESPGMELVILMHNCRGLRSLDLSHFYCWPEDVAPALLAVPHVAANLASLNLLKLSVEGFKGEELATISEACPKLEELYVVCDFDPRFMDYVGDDALVTLTKNCTRLRLLHLVDVYAFTDARGDPDEGFSGGDARISCQGLKEMLRNVPNLEDLVLDVSRNVRDCGPALEFLGSHCRNLRTLKLGQFHGVCRGPQPDGVALCARLERLFIKNCADLSDEGLAGISSGCTRLAKLEFQGCRQITEAGVSLCSTRLRKTLVEVRVSCCKFLDTAATLRALEPIRESVKKLHIDCLWDKAVLEDVGKGLDGFDCTGKVISYGSGDDRNQKWKQKQKESPSGCFGGSSLELELPVLNHTTLEVGSDSSHTAMENCSLDLSASSEGPSYSCNSVKQNCLSTAKYDLSHGGETAPLTYSTCNGLDDDKKTEQNICSEASVGFVDFLGVNEKHQEWQKLESTSNKVLDGCQMRCLRGQSSKRNPLANLECEQLNKRKCILSSYSTELSEQRLSNCGMDRIRRDTWTNLSVLSLWIPVGEQLTPLAAMGLKSCPLLAEIKVRVEGDCRLCPKPKEVACGLRSLACYPALSKLELDCGEVIGFALSAPAGQMDLSLWERWYLNGLRDLRLSELNYWPPQDKDMNRRGLSLPAAGLLSECATLRKLFIHGTAHEHFMMMLLRIPNLRDVQLREDYYPAHDDDTSTEMRTESCRRFEEALATRGFSE